MKFRCEHCGTKYSLADETIRGRVLKIRCRQCKGVMVVRDPERSMGGADGLSAADLRSYLAKSGEHSTTGEKEWFLAKGGERQGPMDPAEVNARLSRGEFGATDHAWRAGMSGWLPIRDVPELATLLDHTGVSVVSAVAPVLPSTAPTLPVENADEPKEPEPVVEEKRAPKPASPPKPSKKKQKKEASASKAQPAKQPTWAAREVTEDPSTGSGSAPFIREPSLSSIGEETRLFLLASGLQQGARRRLIIFGSLIVGLVAVGVGMNQGYIHNPFASGMQTGNFKARGLPSYVRLMQLGPKAGASKRERSIVAAAIIENMSYQDMIILKGWALEMMPLKDDSVEVRLGRADFSACVALTTEVDAGPLLGGDSYDCPPGKPTFRSFPGTSAAQLAMAAVADLEALKKARQNFAETNDKILVQPFHRGQSVNAAEGRAMLECLTGVCRDAVLKDRFAKADAKVDSDLAAEAKARGKSKKRKAVVVEQDSAASEDRRLQKASKVSSADLARMAALQAALGTVRLPAPKVSAPPGRTINLDVKAAAKVIGRGQRGITACVSRAMTRGQSLHGELRARITIQPSGRVASTDILTQAYKGSELGRCIVGKVRRWRFPSFPGKEMVPVDVPWKLPKR